MIRFEDSVAGVLIGALTILIIAWFFQIVRNWMRKRGKFLELAVKLPGPKALPLIGNALQFACKPEQFLERTIQAIKPYENVTPMRFWLGPLLLVIVTEPRDIELIVSKSIIVIASRQIILNSSKSTCKSSMYRLVKPFIGDGLISGSGQLWRSHRKLIAPMLNVRTLDGYINSFDKHSKIFVDVLRPLADGIEFEVMPYLSKCTSNTVSETIMGCRNVNSEENPDEEFLHYSEKFYEMFQNRSMKAWLHPDWIFRLTSGYKGQEKCRQVIHRVLEKVIAVRRKEFAATLSNEGSETYEDGNSILEQLIRQIHWGPEKMTDEELRDEIFTMYLASQDTMALISGFTLLMLGIHKDIQEKVRCEAKEVFHDNDKLNASLLSDFKYLELVLKETLRLFPIAFLLGRTLRSDLALATCVLPEGCEIFISTYMTHRSSRHWKNPEKFIPERFLPEEIAKRHSYAYIPFSGGVMGCIGQKFAIMSLKTIVANVVRNYSIGTTTRMEDIKLKSDISVRSINGYKISLRPL